MGKSVQTTFGGDSISQGTKDWNFTRANTKYQMHAMHPYPARMIPQIPRKLILEYSEINDLILDPFCGSGTVLVECRLLERNGIGNDINPLAALIARVQSTPIEPKELEKAFLNLNQDIRTLSRKRKGGQEQCALPSFHNIAHWFKQDVITDLCCIRDTINQTENKQILDALNLCFSLSILGSSNMDFDNSPTHPRAILKNQLSKHNPDPIRIFQEATEELLRRMKGFYRDAFKDVEIKVINGDVRELVTDQVDLIVTSPPYGEEQNTIGYTRWSKLVLYWLGFTHEQVKAVSNTTLGCKKHENIILHSDTLNSIICEVSKLKPDLSKKASLFFYDYQIFMHNMQKLLKRNAHFCIVIGNRSIMGKRVPMDLVTQEMAKKLNLEHVITHYRKIPNKEMPYSNVSGQTITRENIIVLRKIGD